MPPSAGLCGLEMDETSYRLPTSIRSATGEAPSAEAIPRSHHGSDFSPAEKKALGLGDEVALRR
jgi:hypothetical protein